MDITFEEITELENLIGKEKELEEYLNKVPKDKREYIELLINYIPRLKRLGEEFWLGKKLTLSSNVPIVCEVDNITEHLYEEINNNPDAPYYLLILDNYTYPFFDELKNIKCKDKIRIVYSDDEFFRTCGIDDYIDMRSQLDYLIGLTKGTNMSPLEKMTYYYDIVKGKTYKEGGPLESRILHELLKNDEIVCVGFCEFLKQLYREIGIESYIVNYGDSHVRMLVKVEDSKYGISDYYIFDPTFDSYDKYGLYEAQGMYITMKDSDKRPPFTRVQDISHINVYTNFMKNKYNCSMETMMYKKGYSLYEPESPVKDILDRINNGAISQTEEKILSGEEMIKLFKTVKEAEGFSEDELYRAIQESIMSKEIGIKTLISVDKIKEICKNIDNTKK